MQPITDAAAEDLKREGAAAERGAILDLMASWRNRHWQHSPWAACVRRCVTELMERIERRAQEQPALAARRRPPAPRRKTGEIGPGPDELGDEDPTMAEIDQALADFDRHVREAMVEADTVAICASCDSVIEGEACASCGLDLGWRTSEPEAHSAGGRR